MDDEDLTSGLAKRRYAQIAATLGLRGREGDQIVLVCVAAFSKGLSTVFFETAASTMFVARNDVALLPWIYLGTAVVSVCLGFVYVSAERRASPERLSAGLLACLVMASAAFYAVALIDENGAAAPLAMVWADVHWILIEAWFWAAAGLIFNIRQSKRLFGLIAAGGIFGYVVGGACAPLWSEYFGVVHLLGLSTGATLLCLALSPQLAKHFAKTDAGGERVTTEADAPQRGTLRPYIVLIYLVTSTAIFAFYTLDLLFYQVIEATLASEQALVSFFGTYSAVHGLASLLCGAFFSGRLLARFGVAGALTATPAVGVVGALCILGLLSVGPAILVAFWSVAAVKLMSEVLTDSVQSPSFRILYQPLLGRERQRVAATRESVVQPAMAGAAGAFLLLATGPLAWSLKELVVALATVAVLEILLIAILRRGYIRELGRRARRRSRRQVRVDLADAANRALLDRRLASDSPEEVIDALNLIELLGDGGEVDDLIIAHLRHADPSVRLHALRRLEARSPQEAAEPVRERLEKERRPALAGAALRALAAISPNEGAVRARNALEDNTDFAADATVALLRHGGLLDATVAVRRLRQLVASPAAGDREAAAVILEESGIAGFGDLLVRLMGDAAASVRAKAIRAAAACGEPTLAERLVDALGDRDSRQSALAGLRRIAREAAAPLVTQWRRPLEENVRVQLLSALAESDSPEALACLAEAAENGSRTVREAALRHLADGRGDRTSKSGVSKIMREAEETLADLSARAALARAAHLGDVASALEDEIARGRRRIVLRLVAEGGPAALRTAAQLAENPESEVGAHGVEMLDALLPGALRGVVMPVFEEGADRNPHPDAEEVLRSILRSRVHEPWTLACAAKAAAEGADRYEAELKPLCDHPESIVREAAAWALLKVRFAAKDELFERLAADPAASVRSVAAMWRASGKVSQAR